MMILTEVSELVSLLFSGPICSHLAYFILAISVYRSYTYADFSMSDSPAGMNLWPTMIYIFTARKKASTNF